MESNRISFGEFIKFQREQRGILQEQLCEGLMDRSLLGEVEHDVLYPEKLLRDRLLARLGESGCDYECFLQRLDYEQWKERQNILDALDDRNLALAEQLLCRYENRNDMSDNLARQFYLAMRVQWAELSGTTEKCKQWLQEAMQLTVPNIGKRPLSELILSVQELNLILEYSRYAREDRQKKGYKEVLDYLENGKFDAESLAMLYPKAAVYFGNVVKQELIHCENEAHSYVLAEESLNVCRKGLDFLRNQERVYFAWELLQLQTLFLEALLQKENPMTANTKQEYVEERQQINDFLDFMERYYTKYNIPKETNSFTCFYREHEIYCINHVIRARRTMAKLPGKDLEIVCGRRTLQRLESSKEKNGLQMANVRGLFKFFKLSTELHRAQIITKEMETVQLEKCFRVAMNQKLYTVAEGLLQKLKEKLSMEININRQYVQYEEAFLAYKHQRITKEGFVTQAMSALCITVPYENAMGKIEDVRLKNGRIRIGEKYLTNMEITILTNLATLTGNVSDNPYWCVLKEYFEKLEDEKTIAPILGMYGFVMTSVASYLGNMECYTESDNISEKIIKESLRTKNWSYMERNMYNLAWNNKTQGLPKEREDLAWKSALLDCVSNDVFCKNTYREKKRKRLLEL